MLKSILPALAIAAGTLGLSGAALAGADDITVDAPWSRASIGVSRPGVAYLTLHNGGDTAMTLTGVKTPVAMMPQIHLTKTDDQGVTSMAPAGEITIEPGATVSLEPGGLHAMLMKLKTPLAEGESFPLTLVFSDGSEVEVEVPILGAGARGPGG